MTGVWSFNALGFRVNVQSTFLILVGIYALFGLRYGHPLVSLLTFAIVVFLSIVWHELGHAATARYLRVPVGHIELHGLGGHVTTARTDARRQLMISLAGPFAGLALGGVGIAIAAAMGVNPWRLMFVGPWGLPLELVVLSQILFVNVVWSLVNLLPIRPLDGGNALLSFLHVNLGDFRRANLYTAIVGLVIGLTATVYAWQQGMMFLALLGGYLSYQNYMTYDQARR